MKIRSCRPAQPTYLLKVIIWNNFGNFWPIEMKFGIQIHCLQLLATAMFRNNPTIFSPTSPTDYKIAHGEILKLPLLIHF